jgi:glycerol-3-phosphate dehydrogenase (NAD(P)+)
LIPPEANVVSVAKGLRDGKRMSVIAAEQLHHPAAAVLSGPSHAEEVALGTPTAVVIACEDVARAEEVQALFNSPLFRVYTSTDPNGVEVGAAMKNVIAIAAGISDGIGYGDNAKASLVTRGLAEMMRLGTALGGQASTFSGLSGIGDLMVTCGSRHSRNRGFGERLGKGQTKDEIIASMKQVAEGVWNAATIHEIGQNLGLELPITDQVYQILYEGKDAKQAVNDLLSRGAKTEH